VATVESATRAYSRISPDRYADVEGLLDAVRALYRSYGIEALATPFLECQRFNLYQCLLAAGVGQAALLDRLGLTVEYAVWKRAHRTYRGCTKPAWSWEAAVARARELVAAHGDLPTVEWCRRNGQSSLTNAVHNAGKVWEDLRVAVGLPPSRTFCQSSNGMRWMSQPEALLSDFLHSRGVEHKRGERYPTDYEEKSGRKWARYDLHFRGNDGAWIDVEVWGDSLSPMSGGRYAKTRALKEAWQRDRPNFLGISYKDCLSQERLAQILEPFIGPITEDATSKPYEGAIETSLYASKNELLAACRALAAQMPDGIFPADSWLRKRGKHADRPGPTYSSLAVYVTRWFGGSRAVRKLLGQEDASTKQWTPQTVIAAWRAFELKHGLTPSQCKGAKRSKIESRAIIVEGSKIYAAALWHDVLDEARGGRTARKVKWTPDYIAERWRAFVEVHGRSPSQCMSKVRRRTLPRAVTDEATNLYGAARRLGMLAELRRENLDSRAEQARR
jgi:hypothetical protein